MTTALIVFAHGSRIEAANRRFAPPPLTLRAAPPPLVEAAFLELGRPSLEGAADLLVEKGAQALSSCPIS